MDWSLFDVAFHTMFIMNSHINKNLRGNLLIIAGSDMYPGAATLSALGALRSGAGLVYVATTHFAASSLNVALSEAIPIVCDTKDGAISFSSLTQKIEQVMQKIDCIVLGPGLSRTAEALKIMKFLASEFPDIPKVFDADALYYMDKWTPTKSEGRSIVITPHAGEAAHILGEKKVRVNKDTACALVKKTNCHVLLKGHCSVVATRDKTSIEATRILPGSAALAVPGSGDVLAGAVGALVARSKKKGMADCVTYYLSPYFASRAHALVGIYFEDEIGIHGNLASEIANMLPEYLNV